MTEVFQVVAASPTTLQYLERSTKPRYVCTDPSTPLSHAHTPTLCLCS